MKDEGQGWRINCQAEELAAAVVCLASEAGRFVTGHTMLVDVGFTIA